MGGSNPMSIRIQCCGIIVLLILIFFQGRQRRTHLVTERIFRWVIWTSLACLLLDVGSILAINYAFAPGHSVPMFLVDLVSKLYLITMPALGMCTLMYICADIYYASPENLRRHASTFGGLCALGMLIILALPIEYHKNAQGQVTNTDGPSVYATYAFITIYLSLIVFHLIWDRNHLNHRRRNASFAWMALWVGSFIIQLLNNSLLLAGFACAIGILIIYLSLENPEANLDKQTGLFSQAVMRSYLRQMYSMRRDFSTLLLLLDTSSAPGIGKRTPDDVRMVLSRYLERHPQWMVFTQNENRLLFVFDNPQQAQEARVKVTGYLTQAWGGSLDAMPVKLRWFLVPSSKDAHDHRELLSLLQAVSHKHLFEENLLVVDEKLLEEVRRDRKIEAVLDTAIAEDRIEVFYQPIYSTREHRISSAEALVRIRDEEGRLVPPGLFIPIAEANGMILPLGKLIFNHVCRFIKKHPLGELGLDYIEVNLSVVQCASAELATDYIDIMRRYGITPQHINLEITESASTSAKTILLKNMGQLINFGTSFSLDDFGTGQSNLDYIMDMPVQIAKFDRAMTQAYFSNHRAKQVMNAAIRMIHDMGLSIVSEGIETLEELQTIQSLGVEYIQGFYFSKPLPEEKFLSYLQNFLPPDPSKTEATA